MAQKVIVELVDDLDGGEAAGTVTFGWEGNLYEVDLSEPNRAALAKMLGKYLSAGRKVTAKGARSAPRLAPPAAGGGVDLGKVRAWAAETGHRVSTRGRISAEIMKGYQSRNVVEIPTGAPVAPVKAQEKPGQAVAKPGAPKAPRKPRKAAEAAPKV